MSGAARYVPFDEFIAAEKVENFSSRTDPDDGPEVVDYSQDGTVGSVGPRGPQGRPGPAGPQGPQGIPGVGVTFVFLQEVPSATWTIVHNLNRFPAVVIVDSANKVVDGDVSYVSSNKITVTFIGGFSGSAYLN